MFLFNSVKGKLASISILTIIGFTIVVTLIIYFSTAQENYNNIKDYSKKLQSNITNLNYIAKQKATNNLFVEQYKKTIISFNELEKSMKSMNIEVKPLQNLKKQLTIVKNSYETVYNKQKQIDKNLEQMNQSKKMIKSIFEKVFDYKLIQFMMKLELDEMNFLLNNKIDLKTFGRTHFKMRRSVRGSENFTTNKPMQKKDKWSFNTI